MLAHFPLGWGRGWPPRNMLMSIYCYYTKFHGSMVKRLGIHRGSQKILRRWGPAPLGWWTWLAPRTSFFSPVSPCQIRHSRSNHTSVMMEFRQKNLTFTSPISWSLKVIGTDTDRSATYDFLLVIYSNHGPVSYHIRDKKRYLPHVFNFAAEGVPLRTL